MSTFIKKNSITNFVDTVAQRQGWIDSPALALETLKGTLQPLTDEHIRLFRLSELSVEEEIVLRQSLENVIGCLGNTQFRWVYLISGTPSGIELYIGVVKAHPQADIHDYSQFLKSHFEGNFTGAKLDTLYQDEVERSIFTPLNQSRYVGLMCGVPSRHIEQQSSNPNVSQGIDRLANSLLGETWQLVIVAEPAAEREVNQQLQQLLQLASDLHPHIKMSQQDGRNSSHTTSKTDSTGTSYSLTKTEGTNTSDTHSTGYNEGTTKTKGTNSGGSKGSNDSYSSSGTNWGDNSSTAKNTGSNTNDSRTDGTNTGKSIAQSSTNNTSTADSDAVGSSSATTAEYLNKQLERIQQHINDSLIERFDLGRSKGMFKAAVYLAAPTRVVYERLTQGMKSIFQGNQAHFSPLYIQPLPVPPTKTAHYVFGLQKVSSQVISQELSLIHGIPMQDDELTAATWLNTSELALLAGLPSREIPGIRLRKNVDFAVNAINPTDGFELGYVVQHGRELKSNPIRLDKELLKQHIFIAGVTGAGKTTTCQQILMQSGLPFLVIEPAKTEYRGLSKLDKNILFYTLGNEKISPFRFNPFELLPNEPLSGHIDMLKATFAAVFPMEAAMPYLIEEAIVRSYESKGWNIHDNENYDYPDPWQCQGQCWPILSELLEQLKEVIKSKNFGLDLQQKYEGSLIARLDNLTVGAKGRMLNTRNSIDIDKLLDKKVVIELEELRDEQDKSLLMGLLVGRVAEAMKQRHSRDKNFRHLTLLEEAHRLLSKPSMGDDGAKRLGVDMFTNLLAEVRKYGEGLIIADQIPNKLTPEVMKNTNTKIVHRLFAADDRHAIGDTIGLNDEQKDFLTLLQTGETVVYSAGWHQAVRVKITFAGDTSAAPISHEDMVVMGARCLHEERSRLYPRLAQVHDWTAQNFMSFVMQGSRCLTLWVKFANAQSDKKNTQKLSSEEVRYAEKAAFKARLLVQKAMNEIKEANPYVNVKQALAALFVDAAPLAYPENKVSLFFTLEEVMMELLSLSDDEVPLDWANGAVFGDKGRVIYDCIVAQKLFKSLTSI